MNVLEAQYYGRRRQFRRRGIKYVLLSCLLTVFLVLGTGCAIFDPGMSLSGRNREAYDCIVKSSSFDNMKSVQVLSGRVVGGDLYCYIYYTTRSGRSDFEMYEIRSSGYTKTVYISLYSLTESDYCLASGYLDLDSLNKALESHYGGMLSSFRSLNLNFMGGNSMSAVIVIVTIVVLILNGLLAGKAGDMARDKGYEGNWALMCFFLGPIPYIIVAAMPDRKLQDKLDTTNKLLADLIKLEQERPAQSAQNNPSNVESFLPEL